MLNKSWIGLLVALFLTSCASVNNRKSLEIVTLKEDQDGNLRISAKQLSDEAKKSFVYSCKGCIVGSASEESIKHENRDAFYFDGLPDMDLKNRWFDIPVAYNAQVQKWINYYVGKGKSYFRRHGERAGKFAPLMSEILAHYDMPRDLIFLAMAESGFSNSATSHAAAVGPWQFMPATGKEYNLKIDYFVDERRDPLKATVAASKFLRDLYSQFGNWSLAKAGYNAGGGKIQRAINRYDTKNFWEIAQGSYLKNETKDYVPKINALAIIGKNLKAFGFEDFEFMEPLNFEEVVVPPATDIYKMAEVLKVPFEGLKELNPEILRWHSPVGKSYLLKVPVGRSNYWDYDKDAKVVKATDFQIYNAKTSCSLSKVANQCGVKLSALEALNSSLGNHVDAGDAIKLPFREDHEASMNMYSNIKATRIVERPHRETRAERRLAARHSKLSRSKRHIASTRSSSSKGKKSSRKKVYVVANGDTLWDVARKNKTSIHTLMKANYKVAKNGVIKPGDKLKIQ